MGTVEGTVRYDQLPVEIVRSSRRRKTIQATVLDGRIRVQVPAALGPAEVDIEVQRLVDRLERRRRRHRGVDLDQLAAKLCRRYDLPRPTSVRWVDNQRARWGSCTPSTGAIRLSARLRPWPRYVTEYVLFHELCHLVEANHSPRFHALVARHPSLERAEGFLDAQTWGVDGQGPAGFDCAAPDAPSPESSPPDTLF